MLCICNRESENIVENIHTQETNDIKSTPNFAIN